MCACLIKPMIFVLDLWGVLEKAIESQGQEPIDSPWKNLDSLDSIVQHSSRMHLEGHYMI